MDWWITVTSLGAGAFGLCGSLTSVTIPDSVASLGDNLFYGCCRLASIVIPNSLTTISTFTFADCTNLSSVTTGSGVTTIAGNAFANCPRLTHITIPSNVRVVDSYAFSSCPNLAGIYFQGDAPSIGSYVFPANTTVYYLPGTTGWQNFGQTANVTTALWNPTAQTGDGSFGVRTNQFGFNITGTSGLTVVVEACTNLGSPWYPVGTNTLSGGAAYFSDPQWANYPGRFYRLRSP